MDEDLRRLERVAKTTRTTDDWERFYTALERRGVDLRPLTIRVAPDPDTDSPMEYDGWKLHVLADIRRWSGSRVDPESVGFVEVGGRYSGEYAPSIGLRRKFKVGLAFWVDYGEHGLCHWFLSGGETDRWDTAPSAAVLIWEQDPKNIGAKTYKDREADAKRFLEYYTMWCNGDTFWYDITIGGNEEAEDFGEHVDSCGGFIGDESVLDAIKETLGEFWMYKPVRFTQDGDDCGWIGDSWEGRTWEEGDYDVEDEG